MGNEVLWKAKEHTIAKHQILKAYLDAWLPIFHRKQKSSPFPQIYIIDAFAASGEYSGGEDGSPIIEIKTVLGIAPQFPEQRIKFVFIERDKDSHDALRRKIEGELSKSPHSNVIETDFFNDEAEPVLLKYLKDNPSLKNAFVFLDQFGYSQVSFDLIRQLMARKSTECFIYLNFQRMRPFFTDRNKREAFNRTFGGPEWEPVKSQPDQPGFIQRLYKQCLKEKGGASYVWSFAMHDSKGLIINWLFFCTNNIRGLEEMKRAMWKVDKTGGFSFSDKHGRDQEALFSSYDDEALRKDILKAFAGKTVSINDIKIFVLTETPAHLYAHTLKAMEKDKELIPVGKENISYKEDLDRQVTFATCKRPQPPKQLSLGI